MTTDQTEPEVVAVPASALADVRDANILLRRRERAMSINHLVETSKTCRQCEEPKPETAFPGTGRGRRRSTCGDCRNALRRARGESARRRAEEAPGEARWRALKDRYGISREQYMALSAAQGDACAMCRKPPGSVRPLVVDHCHATGAVRALLCVYCNVIVGIFEGHHQAAADYLAAYGDGNPLLKQ